LLKPFRLEVVEKSVKRALEYRAKVTRSSDSGDDQSQKTDWKII
jgi:hypothetical protein